MSQALVVGSCWLLTYLMLELLGPLVSKTLAGPCRIGVAVFYSTLILYNLFR